MSTVIAPVNRGEVPSRVIRGLGAFVAVGAIVLAAALATGATTVFNVVAFVLFAGLWISFGAALVTSPGTLDSAWNSLRRRHVLVQALIWLLFLPITAALFVWERHTSTPLRLVIITSLAAVNLLMFFPR
jgi:hypothetical protein